MQLPGPQRRDLRGPPPPPGARAALADACSSGICPSTGYAWVCSPTTLVAWPVAPGARGSPSVRGLPQPADDGEVALLVSRCLCVCERALCFSFAIEEKRKSER